MRSAAPTTAWSPRIGPTDAPGAGIGASTPAPGAARRPLARDEELRPGERLELEWRLGWKIEHVFDATQTSGEPLPEPPRPQPLTGCASDGLIDELIRVATGRGFPEGDADNAAALGEADGVTRFDA
jgi:hypothetical protein